MHPSVKAVVDDYWAARYGKGSLQPRVSNSRENLAVRNVPPRQQSIDSGVAEPARATDSARQRRPPDPPPRPSVSSLPETFERRTPLDVAEAEIRQAESRALDEKARLRSQDLHHPKPRALSNTDRDEDLRRELRRVEQEAWERHLEELRWQEKKSIEERRNFEEAYCRKSLGEAAGMSQRQSPGDTTSTRQNSYPDAALSPVVSRQSFDAGVPPWQEAIPPRGMPGRESYGSRMSHRRQDSLIPPVPDSELHPTNSRQSFQTQASDTETQRPYDDRVRQVSFEHPVPPSSSSESQPPFHRTAPDKATLACLLLAHLLHNTGENVQNDHSHGTPSSSRAATQVEMNSPTQRTSIDSYRRYTVDDPEAVDLEDGPFRSSPLQRHGTVRLNRPGGPRDPRRPSGHRSSFSSSIAPSDSVSVASGVDRQNSRRATTPPTPMIDDPPESQLPVPSPSISSTRYASDSRSSLRSAPPGYMPDMDVRHHAPSHPILPASPPPQYSASSSASVPPLDPLRPRKPTAMYHNHHTVPVLPRPDDHTTEDCNVQ